MSFCLFCYSNFVLNVLLLQVLFIGVKKCGTTTLKAFAKQHPDIIVENMPHVCRPRPYKSYKYNLKDIFFVFSCILILLLRESNQSATISSLRSCGNPAKCLSKRHNKETCRLVLHTVPLMLSIKQGSCKYQF